MIQPVMDKTGKDTKDDINVNAKGEINQNIWKME